MVSCLDCHWASVGADPAPFDWMCHAPPVVAMLEGNEATPCRYAREFTTVCGAQGRFFLARAGEINGCLAA